MMIATVETARARKVQNFMTLSHKQMSRFKCKRTSQTFPLFFGTFVSPSPLFITKQKNITYPQFWTMHLPIYGRDETKSINLAQINILGWIHQREFDVFSHSKFLLGMALHCHLRSAIINLFTSWHT